MGRRGGRAGRLDVALSFDFPGAVKELVEQDVPADLATSMAPEAHRGNLRMVDASMRMIQARAAFGPGTVVVAAAGNESRKDLDPNRRSRSRSRPRPRA